MKYEILYNISKNINGVNVYRIRAVESFSNIKVGDLGGWVQHPHNLSQYGVCWAYDEACIYDNAKLYDNAELYDYGKVYGDAEVYGGAKVYGNAEVYDNAKLYGNAKLYDYGKVYGDAEVYGGAKVYDNAKLYGNAKLYDYGKVYGDAEVYGGAKVYGNAEVYGNAKLYGDAKLAFGLIRKIQSRDPITLQGIGRAIMASKKADKKIEIECGCFYADSIDSFIGRIYKDGSYTKETLPAHRQQYLVFAEFLRILYDLK